MSKFVVYPFPRLDVVKWSAIEAIVDGKESHIDQIADVWDSKSELLLRVAVKVESAQFVDAGVNLSSAILVLEATCKDTAYSAIAEAPLTRSVDDVEAYTELRISGINVSESLEVTSHIIAPVENIPWLRRRIISEGPKTKIALNSDLAGFPTSAFSFDAEQIPGAPWRVVVSAEDLATPFAHSVRLELNVDYSVVRELIDGKANPAVHATLVSTITRVLVGTVASISKDLDESRSLDIVAEVEADSITAAASRASNQYLGLSLDKAVQLYRREPEKFEYALLNGAEVFRNR